MILQNRANSKSDFASKFSNHALAISYFLQEKKNFLQIVSQLEND